MLLENDVVGLSLFVVTYYYTDKHGMATGVMFAARILITWSIFGASTMPRSRFSR